MPKSGLRKKLSKRSYVDLKKMWNSTNMPRAGLEKNEHLGQWRTQKKSQNKLLEVYPTKKWVRNRAQNIGDTSNIGFLLFPWSVVHQA